MDDKNLMEIRGSVQEITYRSDDGDFTVAVVECDGEEIIAVGALFGVNEGEEVRLIGQYVNHPQFGKQFKVSVCERNFPEEANAIFRYLASGAVKGIGVALARRIVDKFGDQSLEILEKSPESLAEIRGISLQKAEELGREFQKIFSIRLVMLFFSEYGINLSQGVKIFKKYGESSVDVIKANPYKLCDLIGYTFESSDQIAAKLGIFQNDLVRVRAGIKYVLSHNANNGHTCLPKDRALKTSVELLGVENEIADEALKQLRDDGVVVECVIDGKEYIALKEYYMAELYIAERINFTEAFMKRADENKIERTKITLLRQIDDQEKLLGITYSEDQRKAIVESAVSPVFILTGGPGTGKTTTINGILKFYEFMDMKVMLAAPTGRAAKRMSELCSREAKTIHRLLEVDSFNEGRFKRNERNPLDCDVLIVDETSMVDVMLFSSLLRAVRPTTKIVLVGDSDQLPSVGAGNILHDLIKSGMVTTVALKEVFRQANESLIIRNAHKIVKGEMPELDKKDGDFFFLKTFSDTEAYRDIVELYKSRLPKAYDLDPKEDIQVLSPTRRGPMGTGYLNDAIQYAFNPPSPEKSEIKILSTIFREGDKVIQNKNNYDILWKKGSEEGVGIFNGDIGIVERIDKRERSILIRFDDRYAVYTYDMAEDLELAYAITVHKSQGSEYNAVVLALSDWYDKLYYRNLLYTAVTRAKKLIVVLGKEGRVEYMVKNNRKMLRFTCLRQMLTGECITLSDI